MEEVWKDISLSSLHHPTTTTTTPTTISNIIPSAFHGTNLQDFLTSPFNKHSPINSHDTYSTGGGGVSLFESRPPPPTTVLSLNSGPDCHYLESSEPTTRSQSQFQSHGSNSPFDGLDSCTRVFSTEFKKRAPENEDGSRDGRHKRMMKNRESAARSRARKQAYTDELELEVARLVEENAKLRRRQEKFCFSAPAHLPKKHALCRSLTAPF